MNAGFEDISILYEMMERYGEDWEMVFSEYEKSRKLTLTQLLNFVPKFFRNEF
jgi:hypothetical protein